jgi:hypothetical protein
MALNNTKADRIARKIIQAVEDERDHDVMLAATLVLSILLGRNNLVSIKRIDESVDEIARTLKNLIRLERTMYPD